VNWLAFKKQPALFGRIAHGDLHSLRSELQGGLNILQKGPVKVTALRGRNQQADALGVVGWGLLSCRSVTEPLLSGGTIIASSVS